MGTHTSPSFTAPPMLQGLLPRKVSALEQRCPNLLPHPRSSRGWDPFPSSGLAGAVPDPAHGRLPPCRWETRSFPWPEQRDGRSGGMPPG